MKRLLSLLLVMALIIPAVPCVAQTASDDVVAWADFSDNEELHNFSYVTFANNSTAISEVNAVTVDGVECWQLEHGDKTEYIRFNIENSVININEGVLAIHRSNTDLGLTNDTDSVNLKNSTLKFNKSGSYIQFNFTGDAENTSNRNISLDNSSFVVASGTSNVKFNGANFKLKNGSVLDIAGSGVNFGGENGKGTGVVTLESGSRFSMTGAGSVSLIKVEAFDSDVHVGSGAILNARFDNIKNAKFTGDGKVAWVNRGTPTTFLDGNVYFNTSTMDFCNINAKGNTFGTLYVGVDENGNKKQVTLTASGGEFQMNDGSFVIDGNSTVSASSVFNWAEKNVAKKSYLGAGSTVNVGTHSRINVADIAGTINVKGGAQTAYGWNYALAFGVLYTTKKNAQQGNVNILDTAEINVNLDDVSTSENANFAILGNITSNAGEGKIKSGQYSKFLIRSNIWNPEHQTVLTLNSKDAFAVGGAASQAESTFYLDSSANVKLVINEENNIGTIDFADAFIKDGSDIIFADTKLALELNNTLTVGQFTGVINLILEDDLKEGILRITDMDEILANYDTASSFYIKDEAGNDRVLNENLFIKDLGDGSYTIYTEAVPEPAEWALIFGAIALGFIAYRRRK